MRKIFLVPTIALAAAALAACERSPAPAANDAIPVSDVVDVNGAGADAATIPEDEARGAADRMHNEMEMDDRHNEMMAANRMGPGMQGDRGGAMGPGSGMQQNQPMNSMERDGDM
jgi:hypothetical protein